MPRTREPYPPEFRQQMIELVKAGRTPEELSREFEPTAQTIHNWVRQTDIDAGVRSDGLTSLEREELWRLRRENKQLRIEREILKKAAAWFARETDAVPPKQATREQSDQVTMKVGWHGKARTVRSHLFEILDIGGGTGRRLSAVLQLRYEDLRLKKGPYGAIYWPAATDKTGKEATVPMGPDARAAIDRVLRERPGIGSGYLFPAPGDMAKPVSRHLAAKWLVEGEKLAGLPKLDGSLWHAYRRKWATERKHHPDADVAAAGGWANPNTLHLVYQQADQDTMLQVVLERGELREAK